jgi:hypothetical protein
MSKIACVFINISDGYFANNYLKDNETFFVPNAINSFKKWHPGIEVHYINNDNFEEYCNILGLEEMYDHISLIRLSLVKALMEYYNYDKMIILGIDTMTCSRLDEFINDNENDAIYTLGPQQYVETAYWATPITQFIEEDGVHNEVAFINGDVACYNNIETINLVLDLTIKFWHEHVDQGTMNMLYSNQEKYNKKIRIVDFPYYKSEVIYNVRSKGVIGGYCLIGGKVLDGRRGNVISDRYPMLDFYIKENKLYTKEHKHIKIFHYCEGLSLLKEEDEISYDDMVNEMKTIWFNKETIEFLENTCDCKF